MAASTAITTIKTVYGEDIRRFTVTSELSSRAGCFNQIMQTIGDTYALRTIPFTVTYTDDEGDPCSIGGDEEMREAIRFANAHANKVLKLNVVKTATATATVVPLAVAAPTTPTAATTTVPVVTATATVPTAPPLTTAPSTPKEEKKEEKKARASAKFVRDATIEDGSTCGVGAAITKTWAVQNNGTLPWPAGIIALVSGEFEEKGKTWPLPPCAAGETVEISIDVKVPNKVGNHKSEFQIRNADGTPFDNDNSLTIEVKARTARNVEFVSDVTIADGTRVPTHSSHRKVWRIRNNGIAAWPTGSLLVHNDGEVVNSSLFPDESKGVPIPALAVGETCDIVCHVTAPPRGGRCWGEWHMITSNGEKYDGDYALWTQMVAEVPFLSQTEVIQRMPAWMESAEIWSAFEKLRAQKLAARTAKAAPTTTTKPSEVIHTGIRCDGCQMFPIRGLRYKCTTCPDFDLCSTCESKMVTTSAHTADHIFIQAKLPLPSSRVETKSKCAVRFSCKGKKKVSYHADYIADVTIPDGTVVAMSSVITKKWSVKNSGGEAWPEGVQLSFVGGDVLPAPSPSAPTGSPLPIVSVPRAAPGQIVEITARLQVPAKAGRFSGFYRLSTRDGIRFGHRFWLDVMVPATSTTTTTTVPSSPISVKTVTPLSPKPAVTPASSTTSPAVTPTVASTVVTAAVIADCKTPATTTATATAAKPATATATPPPKYAVQLAKLRGMGFKDDEMLLELLSAADGREQTVIDWLVNPVV